MQYYFSQDGSNQQGPVTLDQLRSARIGVATLVWRDGLPKWTPAGELEELASLFAAPAPTPMAPAPIAPATIAPPQPIGVPARPPVPQGMQPIGYHTPMQYTNPNAAANGMAVTSMVLGIVGLMGMCFYGLGVISSILAVVFGHMGRAQIRAGNGSGDGMAVAGLIMGYIGVILVLTIVLLFVGILIFAAAAAPGPSSSPFVVPPPTTSPF